MTGRGLLYAPTAPPTSPLGSGIIVSHLVVLTPMKTARVERPACRQAESDSR